MDKNIIISYLNNKKIFDEHIRLQVSNYNLLLKIKDLYEDHILYLKEIIYCKQNVDLISSKEYFINETKLNYKDCIDDLESKYDILEENNETIKRKFDDKNLIHVSPKIKYSHDSISNVLKKETGLRIKDSTDINYLEEIQLKLNDVLNVLNREKEENYVKKSVQEAVVNDIIIQIQQHIQNENKIKKLRENKDIIIKSLRVAKMYSKLETRSICLNECIVREIDINSSTNKLINYERNFLDEYSSLDFIDTCLLESNYKDILKMFLSDKFYITKTILDLIYKSITNAFYSGSINLPQTLYNKLLKLCCEYYKSLADQDMSIICLLQLSKYCKASELTKFYNLEARDIVLISSCINNEYIVSKYFLVLFAFEDKNENNLSKFKFKNAKLFIDVIIELIKIDEIKSCKILEHICQEIDINDLMNSSTHKNLLFVSEICLRNKFEDLAATILISHAIFISTRNYKRISRKAFN